MLTPLIILLATLAPVLATPLARTATALVDCDAASCGGNVIGNPDNGHLQDIARQMGLDPNQKCLYWRILENHGGMCKNPSPDFQVVACHTDETQTPPWACS